MGAIPHDRLCQKPERGMNKKKPLYFAPREPWSWHTTALKQSEAWRSTGIHERRILDRLEIEHERHAGAENSNLGVSWGQFVEHDVPRKIVEAALDRLVAVGLLEIIRQGTGGRGAAHVARYRLTHLPAKSVDEDGAISYPDATNEWRKAPRVRKLRFPARWNGSLKKQKPRGDVGTNSRGDVGTNLRLSRGDVGTN
jgi:hypothetical protein